MKRIDPTLTNREILFYHFYAGIFITAFYVWLSPHVIDAGYPGLTVLLMAEIVILTPLVGGHLLALSWKANRSFSMKGIILFQKKMPVKKFLLWMVGGMAVSAIIYVPLYPVGLWLRESLFGWLPEWYFNPTYGTSGTALLAKVFLFGVFIDGIVGPLIEELFFRGYLLPRMIHLKKWAPIINGVLFGLYHFWQPHNLIAVCAMGVILSWIVWQTKNVYLGIAIHCTMNMLGALSGYYAVINGVMVTR